jgi:hypothetical protein
MKSTHVVTTIAVALVGGMVVASSIWQAPQSLACRSHDCATPDSPKPVDVLRFACEGPGCSDADEIAGGEPRFACEGIGCGSPDLHTPGGLLSACAGSDC